jgi:hypothetical protein
MKNPNLIKLEEVTKMKLAKIILRNDTAINWATVEDELILLKGEPAIEFDESNKAKLKIGDGERVWKELPYVIAGDNGNAEIPADLEERLSALEQTIEGFDIRIQNSESGVTAAVVASEEAMAKVEELRAEMAL